MAIKAIEEVRQTKFIVKQEYFVKWFDVAILPLLLDFAGMTYSLLEVDKNEKLIIMATLTNNSGFDCNNL